MLLFLCLFVSSEYLQYIQGNAFERIIEQRSRNEVWVVLFRSTNEEAKSYVDNFVKSSKYGNEIVKYGIVDVDRYMEIIERIGINLFPHIQIYHSKGSFEFEDNINALSLYKTACNYILDYVQPVEVSWVTEAIVKPTAILFSKKEKIPTNWKVLASIYSQKSIRFGFSSDPTMIASYHISKTPTILFINSTDKVSYPGKDDLDDLKSKVESFFEKTIHPNEEMNDVIQDPSEFIGMCIGGRRTCILANSPTTTDHIRNAQKMTQRYKYQWFVGDKNLPFSFMKKANSVWIYHPRKDSFILINSIDDLEGQIDIILGGQGKWIKRSELQINDL